MKKIEPFMNKFEKISILQAMSLIPTGKKILEWGSGNSTLYFSSFLGENEKWISIEHDEDWYLNIKNNLKKFNYNNVDIFHIKPSRKWTPNDGDGDILNFKEYAIFPHHLKIKFDIVLVDGRSRVACMRSGWKLLNEHGIMILHDAQRKIYTDGIPKHCYFTKTTNTKINIDGPVSTLFISKNQKIIDTLTAKLTMTLPKHILIHKSNY